MVGARDHSGEAVRSCAVRGGMSAPAEAAGSRTRGAGMSQDGAARAAFCRALGIEKAWMLPLPEDTAKTRVLAGDPVTVHAY